MNRVCEHWQSLGVGRRLLRTVTSRRVVVWRLAESTPHPLECASVSVENDHPSIPVTVGDKCLIRLWIHKDVGGTLQVFRVAVAAWQTATANLHEKDALVRELKNHVVDGLDESSAAWTTTRYPDVSFVVDGDAVLGSGPVIADAVTAPSRDVRPVFIELHDMRRRPWTVLFFEHPGPMYDEDMVVRTNRNRGDCSCDPVVRQLRPSHVHLEDRRLPSGIRGRLVDPMRGHKDRDCHRSDENGQPSSQPHVP